MKQNKQLSNPYLLNPQLSVEEKTMLVNNELQRLIAHFDTKAVKGKMNFHFYKYASIIPAAFTTIVSSLQVIYPVGFPLWILPVVSAGATVAAPFLGASSAQRIWVNSRTTGQQLQAEQFLFNQQSGRYYNIPEEESLRWEQTVNEG